MSHEVECDRENRMSGYDRDEPKGGVEDKTPVEPKHDQPIWQVYSRRKSGDTCKKDKGPVGNQGNRFSYSKRGEDSL